MLPFLFNSIVILLLLLLLLFPPTYSFKSFDRLIAGRDSLCVLEDSSTTMRCWGRGDLGARVSGNSATFGASAGQNGDAIPYSFLGSDVTKIIDVSISGSVGVRAAGCAVLEVGGGPQTGLKCWGIHNSGQQAYSGMIGYGSAITMGMTGSTYGDLLPYVQLSSGQWPKQVSVGTTHTCVLYQSNLTSCFGDNSLGNL
jgi:hypothetical protein